MISEASILDVAPKRSVIKAPVSVGIGTIINGPITIKGGRQCVIGKYCAIGSDIKIVTSDHGTSLVNLNVRLQKTITGRTGHVSKGGVYIGHNVWIGDNAIILSGVTVGNGAVIAAGSIVVNTVPAYGIVGGNPARFIKTRFDEDKISLVEAVRWWDWDIEKMKRNSSFFSCDFEQASITDIERLIVD